MLKWKLLKDKLIGKSFLVLTILSILIVVFIGVGLYIKSVPVLKSSSLSQLLFTGDWKPFASKFGFLYYIVGTLYVTVISIVISVPVSLLTAIFISEYLPVRISRIITPVIDLLAGIPPVIYGVWGVLVIVPLIQDKIAPHFVEFSSGYSALAGGIVLAIMTFPLIVNLLLEVFKTVPKELSDASLSLGANQWQTIKKVLLKKSLPGIIATVVLAISRAFGETIAVLMVCGNTALAPTSIFDSVYPLPALIANNYGEMMSVPLYESALMFAALILFVIIFLFNVVSRIILNRLERRLR